MKRRRARRSRGGSTFSCGHPRTPENTRIGMSRGRPFKRCRTCVNNYMRAFMRRRNRQRLLNALAQARREAREAKAKLLSR